VFSDPQLAARDMIAEVQHSSLGTLRTLGTPVKLSGTPGVVGAAPPTLGQHTESVLVADLGFSSREVDDLRATGVV